MTFEDVDGPLGGMVVQLYEGIPPPPVWSAARPAAMIGEFTTTSAGRIATNVRATQIEAASAPGWSGIIVDPDYVAGFYNPDYGYFEGALPFEFRFPYLFVPQVLLLSGTTATPVVKAGADATFNLQVKDLRGNPVVGAVVTGATARTTTGSGGNASLSVPVGSGVYSVAFTARSGSAFGSIKLGAIGALGSFAFANQVVPSTATQGTPVTLSVDVTNSGPVTDTVVVDLSIGGTVVASKAVEVAAGATRTVSFSWTFGAAGTFSVSLAGLTAQSVSVAAFVAGLDLTLGIVLMVVLLVAGLAVGFLVARMMRGKPPEGA